MSKDSKQDIIISVYLDDGRVFSYGVANASKAREHSAAIVSSGYRHFSNMEGALPILEHYPPHRITKVKAEGAGLSSSYTDQVSGT